VLPFRRRQQPALESIEAPQKIRAQSTGHSR
jgi:hypothetical protein